jgi:hypothetical protein
MIPINKDGITTIKQPTMPRYDNTSASLADRAASTLWKYTYK